MGDKNGGAEQQQGGDRDFHHDTSPYRFEGMFSRSTFQRGFAGPANGFIAIILLMLAHHVGDGTRLCWRSHAVRLDDENVSRRLDPTRPGSGGFRDMR
ncbi:MAG: hypothetical protein J0H40_17180 [Rhizobiales bacterium]|nr:hypothetical protein [Hyphomicrobiales bacterium]